MDNELVVIAILCLVFLFVFFSVLECIEALTRIIKRLRKRDRNG